MRRPANQPRGAAGYATSGDWLPVRVLKTLFRVSSFAALVLLPFVLRPASHLGVHRRDGAPIDKIPLVSPYAPNTLLRNLTGIGGSVLRNPETAVMGDDGAIYVVDEHAFVYRLREAAEPEEVCFIGNRPLSLAFMGPNLLAVVDVQKGLLAVDLSTCSMTILANRASDGTPIHFADDLAVAADGSIFFSAANHVQPRLEADGTVDLEMATKMSLILGRGTGRLLRWRAGQRTADVLIDGLHFANGVALGPNDEFVLVCETFGSRVHRFFLTGPRAGERDVFASGFPGPIDGIARLEDGRYAVATFMLNTFPLRHTAHSSLLRRVMNYLPPHLWPKGSHYGMVVLISAQGEALQSFHDPDGLERHGITSANPVPAPRARSWPCFAQENEVCLLLGTIQGSEVAILKTPTLASAPAGAGETQTQPPASTAVEQDL